MPANVIVHLTVSRSFAAGFLIMGNDLTLSVVGSLAGMTELRDEWNLLLGGSRSRNICQRWEWLHTWWEIYRDCGVTPCVILVRERGRLVGLAPLYLQVRKKFGLLNVRTLRFLGTGEPEREEVASEYLDIVALDGHEDRVSKAVWQHLRALGSWDRVIFNDVLDDSLVVKSFRHVPASEKSPVVLEKTGIRYSIRLPRTWEAYIASLDPGAAKRVSYKRRKFERGGSAAEKAVGDAAELDRALDDLVRLHTRRWAARGREGAFASLRFNAFHKKLAQMLMPLGMLKVRRLLLDNTDIAVLLNFRYGNTEYFYQGGFDIEGAAKYSPGIVAHVYAIESAIHGGLDHYDFMKAGATSYKSEFGCEETAMYDVCLFSRTWRGRLLSLEYRAREWLRFIRRKSREWAGRFSRPGDNAVSEKICLHIPHDCSCHGREKQPAAMYCRA